MRNPRRMFERHIAAASKEHLGDALLSMVEIFHFTLSEKAVHQDEQ